MTAPAASGAGAAEPIHVKWPWHVQVGLHGVVSTYFYSDRASAVRAKGSIGTALKKHKNWARNERVETVNITDGLGSHIISLANVQTISLLAAGQYHTHALASMAADRKALGTPAEGAAK